MKVTVPLDSDLSLLNERHSGLGIRSCEFASTIFLTSSALARWNIPRNLKNDLEKRAYFPGF